MKVKTYYILIVVSLAAIVGPVLQVGAAGKPSPDKISQRWQFLSGMYFTWDKLCNRSLR